MSARLTDPIAFTNRVYNHLRRDGIDTVKDLLGHSPDDLRDIRNFGPVCLQEVVDTPTVHGFELKASTRPAPPDMRTGGAS